ncbi:Crp/Fnr family transcriptional regulator [Comamonas odontotermitis]|uniref:Crp/Fnr family transcriptional regulator n=1 Tax=Comamonas odontotermitis TaxID=379895 RepID=UPI00375004E9
MVNTPTDIGGLIAAINNCQDEESMINPLTNAQWEILAPYLAPTNLGASQVLFQQGSQERTLFFVESGSLSVHFEDEQQRIRLAIVGPGSIVGEGAFFSHRPRSATVQAVSATRLWGLPSIRFTELCNRQPAVAAALAMAAGSVLAKRLGNRKRRVATT